MSDFDRISDCSSSWVVRCQIIVKMRLKSLESIAERSCGIASAFRRLNICHRGTNLQSDYDRISTEFRPDLGLLLKPSRSLSCRCKNVSVVARIPCYTQL